MSENKGEIDHPMKKIFITLFLYLIGAFLFTVSGLFLYGLRVILTSLFFMYF